MASISVIGVEINANSTTSGGVDLGGAQLAAIEMPATFTGGTFTLQSKSTSNSASGDNEVDDLETWKDVYDSAGNAITITVAQNRIVVPTAAHAAALAPLRYLRVVASVGQNPSKVIKFITKEY